MGNEASMKLKILSPRFSICKVEDYSEVSFSSDYFFVAKTDEENSLVCPTADVPGNCLTKTDGWRAFRLEGILDFSLVGILARISTVLAENGIAIFAVSTFNTDYIFLREEDLERALILLTEANYIINE